MDIIYFEREKQIIRFMLDNLKSKIKILNPTESYNYLINHPNREIVELTKIIEEAANNIKSQYHVDFIKEVSYMILSIACKDKKYIKTLSKILSLIKGYDINIQPYGKIGKINKLLINIVIKTAYGLLSDKPIVKDRIPILLKEANNELIRLLYNEINKIIIEDYKDENPDAYGAFFGILLYILYEDTAYFDPLMWSIDKIARKEIKDYIAPFVKPSELWYCNIWIESINISDEQRKKGKIPRYEHSLVERRMVAIKQERDLKKGLKGR